MLADTLILLALATLQDPAPGIDRGLAAARKLLVSDVEYDLRFVLDATTKEVSGETWMRFRLGEDSDPSVPLVIDFAGSELSEVRVNEKDAVLRAVHNHVIVPPGLLVRGINGIAAKFRSPVAPTGTPLTVYHDPADGRDYFYTLVVPADAHRLFPCFDQPDLRARFRLELDLPSAWVAVCNTLPIEDGVTAIPNGKRWRFAASKPLPTYLMAFACGPFAVVDGPVPQVDGIAANANLRILLRPSRVQDLDLEALVRLHNLGLRWIAQWFDVPYPFDKLDIVLLPGFPYGGMEHAGAIFYRETALVFDHPPTAAELVRRSTLIYHELSHQWFGNLVTMKWFDDLWLKEGFATFVAYKALEVLEPERKAWLRFLQRVKPRAYEIDGTPGTTPVYQELQNLADAKSAYGAIVYNKAPAVLRELHDRLGEGKFRSGLKRFLTKYSFGNADWRDLAAALEGGAAADLDRWSERWLLAPSMPQVRIEWNADADNLVTEATLVQHAIGGGGGTWPLRLQLMVFDLAGASRTIAIESDAKATPIPDLVGKLAPAAVLANPEDIAYGQFVPDARSRDWLVHNVAQLADPLTRAVALSALLEAVREAELDPAAFVDSALAVLASERDADSHGWLLSQIGTCLERYLPESRATPLRARASQLLQKQLREEADSGRELQTFRFLAGSSTDVAVMDLCRAVIANEKLPAGLVPGKEDCFLAAAALLAAGTADDERQRLRARFAGEDVGKEMFLAGAATPTAESKADYWRQFLQLDSPPEQWTQDSLGWFHWRGQDELTLPYLLPALQKVDWVKANRRIFFMPAWLEGFVNGHSSPAALAIVDEFLATAKLSDDVRKKVQQSRDSLARAVRIRSTFGTTERR